MKQIAVLGILTLFLLGCEGKTLQDSSFTQQEQQGLLGTKAMIHLESETVKIGERLFEVEIADEHKERRQGIMFRESLAKNAGMLFVFEKESMYPFWMKNTLIPLTMIWIAEDFTIVDIKNAVPCEKDPCPNYPPSGKAKYVLEVN